MQELIEICSSISTADKISLISLVLAGVGALAALYQWNKGNSYKRAEIVQHLITKVRDDEDIAFIMDIIDWNDGITYDSKFHMEDLNKKKEKELFVKVDKTLSHFSYICYLHKRGLLKNKDMYHFEYELSRIFSNEHIANYLYSLYHWSNSLGVSCSFRYLIDCALDRKYLDKSSFRRFSYHEGYLMFLAVSDDYSEKANKRVYRIMNQLKQNNTFNLQGFVYR